MRNFLILAGVFFSVLLLSAGQTASAQCPVTADVVVRTHTNVTCFGANNGSITVDMTDAATSEPFNFELFDLGAGTIVTFLVTETENKPGRGVVYTNVPPGTYSVLFFKPGCYGGLPLSIIEPPFGFVITEPTDLAGSVTDIDPDCNATVGVGNGQVDISVSGGTAPYTIVWSGPTTVTAGTLSTPSNLDAGNYTVTITDANTCSEVLNIVVPVTTPADAGPPTGVACGTASFSLSGNAFAAGEIGTWTGPAGVTFSPNANTPNATANNLNVGANVLTWTITDAGFVCTGSSDNITVTYSNVDITGSADVVLPCFGATTGTGTFTVTGGIAPFTYSIVSNTSGATLALPAPGPTTSVNFTNGGAGVITLQVQDNSGCTDQVSINITQPASAITLTPSPGPTMMLLCNGDTNGSGSFTASGGTGAHTFTVTSNTTGATTSVTGSVLSFTGAGAGTINVQVRDANNCSQTASITISTPPALVVTPSPATGTLALLCNGDTNGTGSFTASGGTGAHTFTIVSNTTGGTTSIAGSVLSFSGAGAGTISIDVRDANNCLQSSSITITAPPALVLTPSPATGTIALLCSTDTNGTGSFTASGGTGAHTFNVVTNTTGGTTGIAGSVLSFTGAGAGTLTVEVRDANNCLQTSTITITAPPALILTPSPVTGTIALLCNGDTNGSGSFTASGGTGSHTFNILSNTTGGATSIAGSVLSFTGAGAGTINVEVRDANNCLQTATITITAPAALVLTPSPVTGTIALLCNGDTNGTGSFTASGGTGAHTFNILSNTTGGTTSIAGSVLSFTGAGAGTISVEVRDANNCLQTSSITLTTPPALVLTPSAASGTIALLCNGDTNGSGSFSASGGTGAHTFNILTNTTGGTTSITGSVLSFSGAGAGSISIEVRDVNNCLQTASITITAPTALSLTDPGDVALTCVGGNNASGTFAASGGTAPYSFTILGNTSGATTSSTATTFDFSAGGPGSISVQVQDNNGCIQSQSVTITPASNVSVNATVTVVDATCSGINDGSISGLTATGGDGMYNFSIDGGPFVNQTSFTGLSAGSHTISAQDGSGCTSPILAVTVNSGTTITFTLPVISTIPSSCGGNDATIAVQNVTGGSGTYIYILNGIPDPVPHGANFTFSGLTAGNYQLQVQDDATGCLSAIEPITIGNPSGCVLNCFAFNVVTAAQTKRPSCNGGADGVIALTISGNPGNYIVSLIPSAHPPQIRASGSTFEFGNLSENSYQYQISDGVNVCTQSFTWAVTQNIVASASGFQDSPCFGTASGSAVISATGSAGNEYFYSIDGTSWTQFLPGNVINGLPGNGTYNIRIGGFANDPCFATVSVTINQLGTAALDTAYVSPVNGLPAVSYPESPTASRVIGVVASGAGPYEMRLELVEPFGIPVNPPFIIDWTAADELNPQSFIPQKQFNNLYAGRYQLQLRDAAGCIKTFTFIINLDDRIFIPNIFTPNKSDDLNSTFFVRNLPEEGSRLYITDRWGKEVYSSSNYNPNTLWDGGETPDGVYYYRLQIKGGKTYTGWVEILRGTKR